MVMRVVDMFFLNRHNISQCEDSSKFENIDEDFEKGGGDVSSGYIF